MSYTVGEVAKLAKVSVRALHHYDEIGLLEPSGRSGSGYRLYTAPDLERLQQVLFFRELGFALEDIARILKDPEFDRRRALVAQRAMLVEKGERLRVMVTLVDRALESLEEEKVMSAEEMFEGEASAAYAEEAKERWGGTAAYDESAKRTKNYTPDDWNRVREETAAITTAFAELFASGAPPTDARATALAERHRKFIDAWFYPCPREMHTALGEMYVADPRFRENYDRLHPGLATFVRDAIRSNAATA